MITLPYVTVASFKAYPTFLDVMNLRPGDASAADQDQELFNILLAASAWADNYTEMGVGGGTAGDGTLAAHTRVERGRIRVARSGQISYHAQHNPVSSLTALSIGASPDTLTAVADLSSFWIEDARQIVGFPSGASAPGLAALQFGPPATTSEVFAVWTYVAGYANTLLAADAAAGASAITVADPTGLTGLNGGTVLRIWDPGHEEAVTVAPSYVTGSTTVPLTAPLKNSHSGTATTAIGVSALPTDAHLAVILYAAALLQRPDTEKEDTFPSTLVRPNARVGGTTDGTGFVAEAERLLEPYRRVR